MESFDVPEVGTWHHEAPWRQRAVSLILIANGRVQQASDLVGKRELVTTTAGVLLACWSGKWTTQCRIATQADRMQIRAHLA